MATIKNIITGVLAFFIGVLFSGVSYFIIPPLIDIMATGTLRSIFYAGLILVWVFAIIIRPIMLIMKAEEEQQ